MSRAQLSDKPLLRRDAQGLALVLNDMVLRVDFTLEIARLRPRFLHNELLVRAAKVKKLRSEFPPVALDATAGLGEDSLLLAAAGFTVHLYEHDPVIAALLRDGLERAADVPVLAEVVARMHLHEEDSIVAMQQLATNTRNASVPSTDNNVPLFRPDVILLDPMFPPRQKSAAVKKKFQLLTQLEKPCKNEETLLEAAFAVHPQKIVIKRPLKGPFLAGRKPDWSLKGKSVRFDCIAPVH